MTHIRIIDKGLFDCFEQGLEDADGEPVNAEISAVVWDGRRLVVASDKDVPGEHRSPVFGFDCIDGRPQADTRVYYTAEMVRTAQKYEDFALTAAGDHLIATTGFDRVDDQGAYKNHYNRLLIWPIDDPASVHVAAASDDDGVRSSVGLRRDLEQALGAPYFKVEGLAAIPSADGGDDRLLFGIREAGADHENFEYVSRVVAAPYRVEHDELIFTGDFEVVYDFDPARWPDVRFTVGLSSLEYDPTDRQMYFLTSFEVEDDAGQQQIGAYLWRLSLADFHARRDPELVRASDGSVFEFANKAEGVAVLGDHRLFVVYDPDRSLELEDEHPRDSREPHEAPYTLLHVE